MIYVATSRVARVTPTISTAYTVVLPSAVRRNERRCLTRNTRRSRECLVTLFRDCTRATATRTLRTTFYRKGFLS